MEVSPTMTCLQQSLKYSAFLLGFFLIFEQSAFSQATFYPARAIFDGSYNQIVINECDNTNDSAVNLEIAVYDANGEFLNSKRQKIEAAGSWHENIGAIANIVDRTGSYTIKFTDGQVKKGDKLHCRTAVYRPAGPGVPKTYDYAYVIPVENLQVGILSGIYSTFDPAALGNITKNTLVVVNGDKKDFDADVLVYTPTGVVAETLRIRDLGKGKRIDLPIAANLGPATGLFQIKSKSFIKFSAYLIRQNYSAFGEHFFAFPIKPLPGTCSGEPLSVSTMGNGYTDNWLEVANAETFPVSVKIQVKGADGQTLFSQPFEIPGRGKIEQYLNPIIDPDKAGRVGAVRVICDDQNDQIIAENTLFGHPRGGGRVEWAYAAQARGVSPANKNTQAIASANTFLGFNWLKLNDVAKVGGKVRFSVQDYLGVVKAQGENVLPPGGSADQDIHSLLGPQSFGSVVLSTSKATAQFTAEVLRTSLRSDGEIGTITPVPAVIRQKGAEGSWVGNPQSLAQYRNKLTREEAARFLTTTSFGATKADIDRVIANGLEATVKDLLACNVTPPEVTAEAENWLDGDFDPGTTQGQVTQNGVRLWWLTQLMKSPCTLKERMALVLHDRFASSCRVLDDGLMMQQCLTHAKLLRKYTFGNYRELLTSMVSDFLMLVWLNGNLNIKDFPDENFAREHWELFSTGEKGRVGGRYKVYTEQGDIVEAARAFTGYTVQFVNDSFGQGWYPVFNAGRHDNGDKVLWKGTPYQIKGKFRPEDMPRITLKQRGRQVGQYLGKMIFTTFCHDHANATVANQLADLLIANDWNLKPVIQTVIMSEACFSRDVVDAKVKDPITFMLGFLKATGIPMRVDRLNTQLTALGYELLNPVDVFGWKAGYRDGENAETTFWNAYQTELYNAVVEILRRQSEDFRVPGTNQPQFNFCNLNPYPEARSDEVFDHILQLTSLKASPEERTQFLNYLDNRITGNANIGYTEVPDPYTGTLPGDCRDRLAGVLHILSITPRNLTY